MRRFSLCTSLTLATLGSLTLPTAAGAAVQTVWRCWDDWIPMDQVTGRNQWATKCYPNVWPQNYATNAIAQGQYPSFSDASGDLYPTPTSYFAACVPNLTLQALCTAGCYPGDQELLFDGEYVEIEQAHDEQRSTVTALGRDAEPGAMEFSEQSLEAYVAGETVEPIFTLTAEDGRSVRVTSTHPMVLEDGSLIVARLLNAGDVLAGADGEPVVLRSIEVESFEGTVWNVRPRSRDKADNIVVAEGFLTGSVRYQNEWAAETFRLVQRERMPLPEDL